MKHFLGVQNGSIFVSFLCIFTNFFLILLTKRAFLRLLSCIFTNQKNYRQSTKRCRQQHADKHFSRQKAGIPSVGNFFHSYFFIGHHTFRPPATFFRRQPANTTTPATSFLTEQISASRSPTTFTFHNPFQLSPLSSLPQLLTKKLSLRLSFSRCI